MKIKDRIALYFTLISTSMLLAVLCVVYFTFMKFLQADFFERLTDRTMVTAKLYLEADEISRDALSDVRHKYLQKLNGEVIRIYDNQNKATFIGDSAQYWTKATINAVRKKKHLQYKDGERQVVGIYYKDNQGDFVILAAATDQGTHNRLEKLLKIMLFTFISISIIVLLLSRWVAKKMLKPLKKFMEEVKKVGAKNLEFRVEEGQTKDEIDLIAQSFNHLMEDLEQAFILQKTFVANASHELRTPLTRMMITAELALSKERDTKAYQTVIQSIVDDIENIEHMITGLLALAKMDLELIESQLSPIRLDELLIKIQKEWKQHKNLDLEIINHLTDNVAIIVSANSILLQIALDNIIANAFKFSDNKNVSCHLVAETDLLLIKIIDQGPGIPASEQDDVFKPFYTKAADAAQKGEGMGLYITNKILHLFNGSIKISAEQKSAFIISLPILKQ